MQERNRTHRIWSLQGIHTSAIEEEPHGIVVKVLAITIRLHKLVKTTIFLDRALNFTDTDLENDIKKKVVALYIRFVYSKKKIIINVHKSKIRDLLKINNLPERKKKP